MAIYRVFPDADGESHIEEMKLEDHPELGALINVSEVGCSSSTAPATWTFTRCRSAA